MGQLTQKRILLGITGGIAAYKCAELVRQLTRAGAEVRVILTPSAANFITPFTLQVLSGHRVYQHVFDDEDPDGMAHIRLARWADAILIAPATANFMAKLATGLADDLLSTVCLAADSPIAIAPAMNQQMWAANATQHNLEILGKRGIRVFGPAAGEQACGEVGLGRMLEPPQLCSQLGELFAHGKLAGKTVLITAGPTREAIDPVRFMSNASSGKMGYALALAAHEAGAAVTLVSGPVHIAAPEGIELVAVLTAEEMHASVMSRATNADIFIATAAVADYRIAQTQAQKIKKQNGALTLELIPNPDILAATSQFAPRLFRVGFAAETEKLREHALAKLVSKKLDMICANLVGEAATQNLTGFDSDDNELIVYRANAETALPHASKYKLATQLIELIAESYHEKYST